MEKILITGVGGFIGSNVASRFLKEGYEVVGVDDFSTGKISNVPHGVDLIEGDLAYPSTIDLIPQGCSSVLHLAGQSSGEISFDDPLNDISKNTISTLNLIRYAKTNIVKRFIYASSMSVYGAVEDLAITEEHSCSPLSCYGVGKYASERYLQVYKNEFPSLSMRMFNVYGPGQDLQNLRQGMVSIYVSQALASGRIEVKGGIDRFRDFIFIDDVVEAWFRAATYQNLTARTLNIGTGTKTHVRCLLKKLCSLVTNTSFFLSDPTLGDQSGIYADTSELASQLGIDSFVSLDAGLEKFVEWARNQEKIT